MSEHDDVQRVLSEVEPIARGIINLLMDKTEGHGGKIVMSLGAVISYLEIQHEGTIENIVAAATILEENVKRNRANMNIHPDTNNIN